MEKRRKPKLMEVEEALSLLRDGMLVAIGGQSLFNKPCHLVRQIAKKGLKGLNLTAGPYAGFDYDLLIGIGAVKSVIAGNVGFEYLGFAPNFRKACQEGSVEAVLGDEASMVGGYMASAEGIPFHPIISLFGSDVAKYSPQIKEFAGPFNGERLLAVKAIVPDVALLHAAQADEYGNVRGLGGPFDLLIAKASKTVIVSVEELVSNKQVLKEPEQTAIPSYLVTAVVEAPFGAHPCMCQGRYVHDEEHLKDYLQRARSSLSSAGPSAYSEYLKRYVYEPNTIYEYLERVGGLKRMIQLRRSWSYGES